VFYQLPQDMSRAQPLLQRFMRENLAVETRTISTRRRPQPPRGVSVVFDSTHFNVAWAPPANLSGILGYYIYRWDNVAGGGDNNRVFDVNSPNNLFAELPVPSGYSGFISFWVSCYTQGLESIRVQGVGHT
jgi:hypothetical protein